MSQETVILILSAIILFPILMTPVIIYACRIGAIFGPLLSVFTALVAFILTMLLYPVATSGTVIQFTVFEVLPNLEISLRLDILSFSLAALATFVWLLCTIYSVSYMAHEHACGRYYPVLIFTLGSCQGIFFAGDLFSLFVFFELSKTNTTIT